VPFLFVDLKEMKMKNIIWLVILSLAGCAQLQRGQEQPVISKMSKDKGEYFFTTCAGAVEDWPSCYDKASRTCNKNYVILSKEDNNRGTKRELTFQCKK